MRKIDDSMAGGHVIFDTFTRRKTAPSRNVRLAIIVGADLETTGRNNGNHHELSGIKWTKPQLSRAL